MKQAFFLGTNMQVQNERAIFGKCKIMGILITLRAVRERQYNDIDAAGWNKFYGKNLHKV